jgi:hypothetical protein
MGGRAALAVLFLSANWGCGAGAGAASPEETVARFATALREARLEDAYAAMSTAYRQRVSFSEFERHVAAHPDEARDVTELLAHPEGAAEQSATVRFADGEVLALTREAGVWTIATNVVDFYDQSTPRAAIRSFVRAMERGRYDVVMAMVPDADREGMTPERMRDAFTGEGRDEVERMIANLRAHVESPIEEVGDRATMPYGGRYEALFVREDGLWKIESPE